ncbi:hypothetical protein [Nocardia sp. NPDC019395]|uniref:glycoside hydrolase family 130 protein n=1 Tax=Nocardia sp. NPDC019395 TaxID=3154686 RepID=UPI0033D8C081
MDNSRHRPTQHPHHPARARRTRRADVGPLTRPKQLTDFGRRQPHGRQPTPAVGTPLSWRSAHPRCHRGRAPGVPHQRRELHRARIDYRCGRLTVALDDPATVTTHTCESGLQPTSFEEIYGMSGSVTFVEGLVHFHGRWLVYYGQSDTTLAVAIHNP